jgi:hypothetical protein
MKRFDKPWLAHYDAHVPAELEIPDRTLLGKFDEIRSCFGDKAAIHFLGITLTYDQLMSRAPVCPGSPDQWLWAGWMKTDTSISWTESRTC